MNTGSALAQFTITLRQAVTEPVQVEWFTSDGTAKAGVDYAASKGTAVFLPGETSKTVDILVYGRAVGSEDRSFYVEMLPPTNAILGSSIGECIITVDTSGSTPVTQIIVPAGPQGIQGKSAYQSYLDTTTDNPPMTEAEWVESLKGDPAEIAQEVAPLIDVGSTVLTAEGTETLGHPDATTVKAVARRVAFAGAAKIATVTLADGDNLIALADLAGDTVDFSSPQLVPRIFRGSTVLSPEWSVGADGKLMVKAAVAGDQLYVCQYDWLAVKKENTNTRELWRRSLAEAGLTLVDGSFEEGATVTTDTEAVWHIAGAQCYVWEGALSKAVAAGTNPVDSGGVAAGAWQSASSRTLRSDLGKSDGASIVQYKSKTVAQALDLLTVRSDDFATIQDWAAHPARNKVLVAGTYPLSSTLLIKGETLTIEGDSVFQPDAPMIALRMGSDERTLLTTLTGSVSKGATSFTVAGVAAGDTLCFWNPVNGSWSGFRDNHRQGEFIKVRDYSGGVANFEGGLLDSYPSGTKVYKMTIVPVFIKGQGTISVDFGTYNGASAGMEIVQGTGFLAGVEVRTRNAPINLHIKRCFRLAGLSVTGIQSCLATGNTDYGIIVSNSQNLNFDGVKASGGRHGMTMGGNGEDCSIVNRFNHFSGEFMTTGQGGVGACDHHGNCEFCTYKGYAQGLVIGGSHNDYSHMYVDGIPGNPNWPSVLASELKSVDHDLSCMTIVCTGNPGNVRGVVDIAGNSSEIGPLTTEIGTLNMSNTTIVASSASYVFNLRDWGATANYNVNLSGLVVRGSSSNTAVRISPGSGSHMPTFVSLGNNAIPRGMNIIIDSNVAVIEGLRLTGVATVPVAASAASGTVSVSFNRTMPANPKIQVSRSGIVAGGGSAKMALTSLNATTTGFDIEAYTVDAAGVVSARSETVNWVAEW